MQLRNKIEQASVQLTEAMCLEICYSVLQRLRHCFDHHFPIGYIALFTAL